MKKKIEKWPVKTLREIFSQIDFPGYQREPNLWSLVEKQRLIDSMIRHFDIASLYFYRHEDDSIDCVDGRQRIGAIMSFLGENPTDADVNFQFRILNEIYEDSPSSEFKSLEGKTFSEIERLSQDPQNQPAKNFVDVLLDYPLTVVMLSDSSQPEEFNLQFTRLNLGTIINSGEKLHAMVGDLRDECFDKVGLHPFLEGTDIPTRRYAREQVAAQIMAQVFSLSDTGEFTRTRHFDLQRLLKLYNELDKDRSTLVDKVKTILDLLDEPFREVRALRNRAITVSTVLLAWKSEIMTPGGATDLAEFIEEFVSRLNWQVKRDEPADREFRYLTDFQRSISQASAESYSVETRAQLLEDGFKHWRESKILKGDSEWKELHPGLDSSSESRIYSILKSYQEFKKPILSALETLGGSAYLEDLSTRVVKDLKLPSEENNRFWEEEEKSHRGAMRSRKDLFEDRLKLAIRRLKDEKALQERDDRELVLVEQPNFWTTKGPK